MEQAVNNNPKTTPKKHPSAWEIRGFLSTIGQSLQLISAFKSTSSIADRHSTIGFSASNLLANAINIAFGAQKKHDTHQLHQLKTQINTELAPLTKPGTQLPDVNEQQFYPPHSYSTLQKHSVLLSEFGLRTLGSLSLIVPITSWGRAFTHLRNGTGLAETFRAVRSANPVTYGVGLFSLAGKAFVLAATEPDPYNPNPPTLWRTAREKLMFRLSTLSEAIGAGWMAHERFTNQKIMIGDKLRPDYYGGFGSLIFDAGYVARWYSPYGTREVDLPELYAHAAKALHALPPEKIEPMLNQISTELAHHFHEKNLKPETIQQEIKTAMAKPRSQISSITNHEKPTKEKSRE